MVLADLAEIVRVFESTEGHLSAIDATAARIEKRILTAARYMDRAGSEVEGRIVEAMNAIAASSAGASGISVKPPLLNRNLPIGPAHIPLPRRERSPIPKATIRDLPPDPAFAAYRADKAAYSRRTSVTPDSMLAFLERHLRGRSEVKGSDIVIESIDDFVPFQRLREIPTIFGGSLARRFELTPIEGFVENEWITCQNFVIRRTREQKNAA